MNDLMLSAFADELGKIKQAENPYIFLAKKTAPLAAGAGLFYALQKAEQDRRLGRQLRLQSRRR